MELNAPEALVRWKSAPRLVPSRYPVAGLLDRVADPADLDALFELEGWTNDRISAEVGLLHTIPRGEWVTGRPMSSVVMAAYCHPREGGSRFSSGDRGAWYAARAIETAIAECVYHRTAELREVGAFETRVQMRVYLADFSARFHDIRGARRSQPALYDPVCTPSRRSSPGSSSNQAPTGSSTAASGIPQGSASRVFGPRSSATCAPEDTTSSSGQAGPSLRCESSSVSSHKSC